ncbi:putative GDP-fucose protein O-fucosyltransferase [Lupinus albus]|uniref:Putative GDP-fucose protein O-fucosyltransferase n=1 Tax=Lupinus albus TaxID=3870 RepID=A0A6A4Q912_LUPAL|nr:putative GDP-fucose protein O-fucosyltransferase [Lupinus albus]
MKVSNSSSSSSIGTEPIGQNLIKVISNLCFSFFVFSVLIFTVIAITYQPPDPWIQSAPALTQLFTRPENATFQIDTSIIKTGEDITPSPQDPSLPFPPPSSAASTVTEASIEKIEYKILNSTPPIPSAACSSGEITSGTLNCSDPRVLIAVQRFNLRAFKSIAFFEYLTPYRDFRRFKIGITDDCRYKVVHAGGWHSGANARRNPARATAPGGKGKTVPRISSNSIRDDEINDTIPTLGSQINFRNGKYLYYSRGGDYCKGMNHYMWSFLCGLGEAMYLNRTFVMDLSMCLAATYNPSNKDEEGKDFRYYFDFEHLKEEVSIVEEGEFLRDWKKWDRSHLKKRKVPVKKVLSHKVTPIQLKKDKSTILWRQFDAPEPENYWYRVCEGQAAKYIQRPWHALWKSKRLMNIVTEISGRMDWDFDAVHVVRGEKAQRRDLWPNLDSDTSPDALVEKLKGMVQPWRNLYIATNEPFYNYFDKLRSNYKVHLLDDYKELWGNTSEWYNETSLLNNGKPVEFDGYMRVAVDTEVFYRGTTRVETFYNLTQDCKDGVKTC